MWLLEEHEYVLYVDADTLLVGPVDELFGHIGGIGSLEFAAALTRSLASLNTGVMLLRPSADIFSEMMSSYRSRAHWTGTSRWSGQLWNVTKAPHSDSRSIDGSARVSGGSGDVSDMSGAWRTDLEEQDWRNEFLATRFTFHGELNLGKATTNGAQIPHNRSGTCARAPSCERGHGRLSAYIRVLQSAPADGTHVQSDLGSFCTLPISYNFCATAPCLEQLADASGFTGRGPPSGKQYIHDSDHNHEALGRLQPKILHWPGSLRKPWQRCRRGTRSILDEIWWQTYHLACKSAPLEAPCHIRC